MTRKKKVLDESDENLLVLKGSLRFFIEETVGYLGSKECDLCKRDDLVESGIRLLAELDGREFMESDDDEEN